MSGIPYRTLGASLCPVPVTGICCDSRRICPGQIFICIKGSRADGKDFAAQAAQNGCQAIVTDCPQRVLRAVRNVPVLLVSDARRAYAAICRNFYGKPDRFLITVGITGTKGKTSTAWMIYSILKASGRRCALIGTTGIVTEEQTVPLRNTTPEPEILYRTMRSLVEKGYTHVVLEVSSQALKHHRTEGMIFDYGLFTNLYPDHIGPGEHDSPEEYAYWKVQLLRHSVHGICCFSFLARARKILKDLCISKDLISFGPEPQSDYCLEDCTPVQMSSSAGLRFTVGYLRQKTRRSQTFFLSMIGSFQAQNALAAFACTDQMGCSLISRKNGFRTVSVPGRGELIYRGTFHVMIDYAHNGESLKSLLTALRSVWKGELVCLFGCGGNRPRARRLEMSRISGQLADETILTEDNSRKEPLADILSDLENGIRPTGGRYRIIPDRAEAIRQTVLHARAGQLIVLAGKGHEEYLERDGIRIPFSERLLVKEAIQERKEREHGTHHD